jgi:hypothetical protein
MLQALGAQTWGTKSFEFWTLLAATLWLVRPRTILELGSGRSTSYLADYAQKEGAVLVSVEQNRRFAYRARLALRAGFVDARSIHYIPVQRGWYDLERVRRVAPRPCELIFVDGPSGAEESLGTARRDDARAIDWLKAIAAEARAVIVDDLQRPDNLAVADELIRSARLEPFYLDYEPEPGVRNTATIAVGEAHATALESACTDLRIHAYRDARLIQR